MAMVTELDALLPLLNGVCTAKQLAAVVVANVPVHPKGLRQRLALTARDSLGFDWTDKTTKWWLQPSALAPSREAHAKKVNAKWYDANAAKASETSRTWRQNNPEASRDKTRRWREQKPVATREYHQRWYDENREAVTERKLRWSAENPTYFNQYCKHRGRRLL